MRDRAFTGVAALAVTTFALGIVTANAAAQPAEEAPGLEAHSGEAAAEMATEPAGAHHEGGHKAGRAWVDLAFYTNEHAGTRITSISPLVRGRYLYDETVAGELALPMAGLREANGHSDGRFLVGNVSLSGLYHMAFGHLEVEAGLTVGLPTSMEGGHNALDHEDFHLALASRGRWESWHWERDTVALVVPVRAEYEASGWGAGADVSFGPLIPVDGRSDEDVVAVLEVGGWGGLVRESFRAGLRIQSVTDINGHGDKHQAAVEPFAMYTGGHLLAGAGVLVNLDGPFGFVGNDADIWALRLYLGAQL